MKENYFFKMAKFSGVVEKDIDTYIENETKERLEAYRNIKEDLEESLVGFLETLKKESTNKQTNEVLNQINYLYNRYKNEPRTENNPSDTKLEMYIKELQDEILYVNSFYDLGTEILDYFSDIDLEGIELSLVISLRGVFEYKINTVVNMYLRTNVEEFKFLMTKGLIDLETFNDIELKMYQI